MYSRTASMDFASFADFPAECSPDGRRSVMILAGVASWRKSKTSWPSRDAVSAFTTLRNDRPCDKSSFACFSVATSANAKYVSAFVRITGRTMPHLTR